jgi:hypothetical protein
MFAMMLNPSLVAIAARYNLSLIEAAEFGADLSLVYRDENGNVVDIDADWIAQCPCYNGDECMGCNGSGFFV